MPLLDALQEAYMLGNRRDAAPGADPDPLTDQNRMISTTYRMEAVPAFLAHEDGKVVAVPRAEPLGGVLAPLAATEPR